MIRENEPRNGKTGILEERTLEKHSPQTNKHVRCGVSSCIPAWGCVRRSLPGGVGLHRGGDDPGHGAEHIIGSRVEIEEEHIAPFRQEGNEQRVLKHEGIGGQTVDDEELAVLGPTWSAASAKYAISPTGSS